VPRRSDLQERLGIREIEKMLKECRELVEELDKQDGNNKYFALLTRINNVLHPLSYDKRKDRRAGSS